MKKRASTVQMLEAPNKVKCWTILNRVSKFLNSLMPYASSMNLFTCTSGKFPNKWKILSRDIKHMKSMQTKYIKKSFT